MIFEKMLLTLSTLVMLAGSFLWFWKSPQTFPQEATISNEQLASQLKNEMTGEIVFDSNRSGTFGLYIQAVGDSDARLIYDSEAQDMFPDPSPDGKSVVFAKHNNFVRGAPGEIWICDMDGSNARKLVDNGTFPSFSSDGKTVYFERQRRAILAYSLEDGSERELLPAGFEDWKQFMMVKPRVSSDGTHAYFTTDRGGRWNAYSVNLQTGDRRHVGRGCEPTPFTASDKVAWITKSHVLSKSGVGVYSPETDSRETLNDAGPPYGHEYFPTLAQNDRFLLYAACPGAQHDHNSANYQIFVRDLSSQNVLRLTHDTFTNRWPRFVTRQN